MEDLFRDVFAESFGDLRIEMGIALEHLERAMAHGSGQFEVGGSLGSSERGKSMAHVMRAALFYLCGAQSSFPSFLNVAAPEGGFAGKDKGFEWLADLAELLEFFENRVGKRDAARASVFCFFEVGELVIEVDMFPFEAEDFSLARAGCKGDEDDGVEIRGAAFAARG